MYLVTTCSTLEPILVAYTQVVVLTDWSLPGQGRYTFTTHKLFVSLFGSMELSQLLLVLCEYFLYMYFCGG